jgi:LPS-assembly protein
MSYRGKYIIAGVGLFAALVLAHGPALGEEPLKKVPVKVKADKLDYDRNADVYVAEGHVRIEQADKVVLDNKTGQAVAEGKAYLQQKGEILRAEKLEININTRAGIIHDGEIFMTKDNYHVRGARIEKKSDTVFRVEQGTFTTCDEGGWSLKADEINVDMDRYATGKGVSFNVGGLPVFYTPYLLFPVRRQTGLLIPEGGYSSSDGFFMKNSVFWAVSDYQDATLISDYRAKHGIGTGVEYRYVNSRDSHGKLWYNHFEEYNNWITDHPAVPSTLWEFKYEHQEEIAEDLSLRADINLVSDNIYYRELEKTLEIRSQPYLDSNAFYVERWDTASLSLSGQYSTDLTPFRRTVSKLPTGKYQINTALADEAPVQKLPELRYQIFQEHLAGPFWLSFDGSLANFVAPETPGQTPQEAAADLQRASIDPQLTARIPLFGLTLIPHGGFRALYYSKSVAPARDQAGNPITADLYGNPITVYELVDEPTNLKYFYGGADLNARLSRVYGADNGEGIGKIRHSIEPTISYDHIPGVDTADIPLFDALDSVAKRNLVTFSLINRLTAHYQEGGKSRSFDMMILRIAESYDILEARRADDAAAFLAAQNADSGTGHSRSDIQAELVVKTPRLLTLSVNGIWDPYADDGRNTRRTSSSGSLAVRTEAVDFDVTHRFLREPRTQFLIGGIGFKLGNWDLHGRVWHDLQSRHTTQEDYRTFYKSQCWGLGISYIKKPGDTQYLLTLELTGLGALKF